MSERRDPERDELMRDIDTEQLLADWFHEEAPTQEPPILLPAILARTALTRRRPKWLTRDWWLSVLGLVDRRPPTMMISIGFVAVLTALTLMALLVVAPGQSDEEQLPPPDGALVVAQDGSGDYETIEEAVVGAADGDVVFIKPGEYTAAVRTDKSVTFLGGAAERDGVMIRAAPSAAQAFETREATVRFERLSIGPDTSASAGPPRGGGVLIVKGSVEFADVAFSDFDDGCAVETSLIGDQLWAGVELGIDVAVVSSSFSDGSVGICGLPLGTLRIEDSVFHGLDLGVEAAGEIEVARSTFEQNDRALHAMEQLRLTDSTFIDNREGLVASDGGLDTEWVIVGNAFTDNAAAMSLGFGGFDVRGNTIRGGETGLQVSGGRRGTIAGNEFSDVTGTAVTAQEARATFEGNTITGGGAGIALEGGVPDVRQNRVEGVAGTGISVGSDTGGSVTGNELCENGTDLDVAEAASTTVAGNTFCAE